MRATVVAAMIRWWVRVYTTGLSPTSKEARRAEIESDLWEQLREAELDLVNHGVAGTVFMRWVMGIPDDLLWRLEHGAADRASRTRQGERSGRMDVLGMNRGLVVAMASVAVLAVVGAIGLMVIDNIQYHQQTERIMPNDALNAVVLMLFVIALLCIPAGFLVMNRLPAAGAVLAVGGSMTAGILVFWLIVPVLIALVISGYAVHRAARVSRAKFPPSKPAT